MYRNTYVEVNLKNIENNVRKIIDRYNNYKYYFGVVKADCYAHNGIKTVETIIKGGCNYIAVATLDEAIEIRQIIKDIPILCLGIVPVAYIGECFENDITITVNNLDYLNQLLSTGHDNLKIHIKINTGMNRLGVNNRIELNTMYNVIKSSNLTLEGIYTHIYNSHDEQATKQQFKRFEEIFEKDNEKGGSFPEKKEKDYRRV